MSATTALPARFRRPRLLIVGPGDVGQRVLRQLGGRLGTFALVRTPQAAAQVRALGARALAGDLDRPATLQRLAGIATHVLHLAPPPGEGEGDARTAALLRVLARRAAPAALVYVSTSGVYGDCAGERVDETRRVHPQSARARRRVAAEALVRGFASVGGTRTIVLRAPGIYALDRPGGTPRQRLLRAVPVLQASDDVYTNHIHADDLARACALALWRGRPQRALNVCDDSVLTMGDYFDLAADLLGLPHPPRVSRQQAQVLMSPAQLSFLGESRRLSNHRLKAELRLRLRYPCVDSGLARGPTKGEPRGARI